MTVVFFNVDDKALFVGQGVELGHNGVADFVQGGVVHLLHHGHGEALGGGVGGLGSFCCLGEICGSGGGFGGLAGAAAGEQGGDEGQGQDQSNNLFHFQTPFCCFRMGMTDGNVVGVTIVSREAVSS